MSEPQTKTVLLLGANGRTGLEIIRTASNLPTKPAVHAFLLTNTELAQADRDLCAGVHSGDATVQADLKAAIDACKPDAVIIAIGTNSLRPTTVRADCAKALFEIIKPGSSYENIRVATISAHGASGGKLKVGMGVGAVLQLCFRNVLKDHSNQESALKDGFGTEHAKRLLIVRPTTLKSGKPTGKVATFTADEWPPTGKIDRADVAQYVWQQLMGDGPSFGSAVSITTAK